jgi:hypothetical protein
MEPSAPKQRTTVDPVPESEADAEGQRVVRFVREMREIFGEDVVLDFEWPPTNDSQQED